MSIFNKKPKTLDQLIEKHDQRIRDGDHGILYNFFIPKNSIEVIFILVCFALAWYSWQYDIPQAKREVLCHEYWKEYGCNVYGQLLADDPYYFERMYGWNKTAAGMDIPEKERGIELINGSAPEINISQLIGQP